MLIAIISVSILLLPQLIVWGLACLPGRAEKCDCMILLGARVRPDGRCTTTLRKRCEAAAEAYQRGIAPVIIASGGQCSGEPSAEAPVMRAELISLGVPEDAIETEDRSKTTAENMRFSRVIMEERGFRTAAVVTTDYHIFRALMLARREGISARGVKAPHSRKPASVFRAGYRECYSMIKNLVFKQ